MEKPYDAEWLNIDDILGKPKNRVAMMGVELEGAWKIVPKGVTLERDGSVFPGGCSGHKTGELPVGPFQPIALGRFLRKYYPDMVDKTCGMHVHMSFESLKYYQRLMVAEYQETIIEYMVRWAKEEGLATSHPIWDRLAGKNEYCGRNFWPDQQVSKKKKEYGHQEGGRYTMVHYCGRQNTIEVRVLPMMSDAKLATSAIHRLQDITNACLVKLVEPNIKIQSQIVFSLSESFEESIEEEIPLTSRQRKLLRG